MLSWTNIDPSYYFYISLGSSLVIFILFTAFRQFIKKCVIKLFDRIKVKSSTFMEEINLALSKPLDYLWMLTGLSIALAASPFVKFTGSIKPLLWLGEDKINLAFIPSSLLSNAYKVCFIILLTWAAYNFESLYEKVLLNISFKLTDENNSLIIRFTAKIIRFLTIAFGVFVIISQFTDLNALITGVGLGGVAFTFIAKDSLSNIMSGVILMIDKPFAIGDWIQVGTLEGLVEDISFRSTRIRTFTQGLVLVPNLKLSNENIINWSTMPKRRVSFELGLTYHTSCEQLKKCIGALETLLADHINIEPETSLVHFSSFGDYALNLTITYFTLVTDLKNYSKTKEQINLKIIEIIENCGLEIAFPTQNIIMAPPDEKTSLQD